MGSVAKGPCTTRVPKTMATAPMAVPIPMMTPRRAGPAPNSSSRKNGSSTLTPSTDPDVNASPMYCRRSDLIAHSRAIVSPIGVGGPISSPSASCSPRTGSGIRSANAMASTVGRVRAKNATRQPASSAMTPPATAATAMPAGLARAWMP